MGRTNSRDQIVAAAVAVMAAGGAEALTAAALAQAAGVSKATLFHHFDSLDDIVLAAFEHFLMGMQSLVGPSPESLRGWLVGLGKDAEGAVPEGSRLAAAYFAFAVRAQSDPRLRARLLAVIEEVEAAFVTIARGLDPSLGPAKARALAGLLIMAGDGLVLHRGLFPERAAQQQRGWQLLVDLVAPKESEQ